MAKDIHQQVFTEGMNTVLAPELMGPGQARYLLNCRTVSSASGNVGVLTNVKGNVLIETPLPAGTNRCIGSAADEENLVFYFFVYNSLGYHTIQQYAEVENRVLAVLTNLTDTGGVDILKFDPQYLILHADVIQGRLYWTQGNTEARKLNIQKCLDKSEATGYGSIIREEYIEANKRAPQYGPKAAYFTDRTKNWNRLYGHLFRFCSRFIYDDGEVSNWSDYSNVPLPAKESYLGTNAIPTDNNGIKVRLETGSRIVHKIELAMQAGSLGFVSIALLDKAQLGIGSDSLHEYLFFNDGSYPAVDPEKLIRPYSFFPKRPLTQAFVNNAMVYAGFYEGFNPVQIDMQAAVSYTDLFLASGAENKLNSPSIAQTAWDYDYVSGGLFKKGTRDATLTITIGYDVRKGNTFELFGRDGGIRNYHWQYTAEVFDTAETVANQLKSQIRHTFSGTDDLTMGDNQVDGGGNVSWQMLIVGVPGEGPITFSGTVNPVNFQQLKDSGESVSNWKLGSARKFGILYEDGFRKSAVYTDDALTVRFKHITDLGGIKAPVVDLTIQHQPPAWATTYQVVRSRDLTYSDYIQLLIQKVVEVDTTAEGEFLDLIVGSLYTYQRMHENTHLAYEFQKGDRLRLIQNTSNGQVYPFHETEVLSYKEVTEQLINRNITSDGSDRVVVDGGVNPDYVGRYIVIDTTLERLIVGVEGANTYVLDRRMPFAQTDPSFWVVDRRGTVRIRKPQGITLADNSLVEIYKPAVSGDALGSQLFYCFGKKFPIIHPGTENRVHAANGQDQTASQPAIVKISEGDSYVRNRELPTNNAIPGTQVAVAMVEDRSFSDFYASDLNDNGRPVAEDLGEGEKFFGSRARWSNNYIEDTRINGLNDFDNADRMDYNDRYGDIKLLRFNSGKLYVFKALKTGWVPVHTRQLQLSDGQHMLGASDKLLNPMVYYAWEGGIGDHPESYIQDGTRMYFASTGSGAFLRLSADGITPISITHGLDNVARELLASAARNGARIYGGVDQPNGEVLWALEEHPEYVVRGLVEGDWALQGTSAPTSFALVTAPTHGTATLTGDQIRYVPTAGYTGPDSLVYRALVGGIWVNRKVCITVTMPANRPVAWRVQASSIACELSGGNNTGNQAWATLEEYYTDTAELTGRTKANTPGDPDYVAPIVNLVACPLPGQVGTDPQPYDQPLYLHIGTGGRYMRVELRDSATYGQGSYVPAPAVLDCPITWKVDRMGEIITFNELLTLDVGQTYAQATQGETRDLVSCIQHTEGVSTTVGLVTYLVTYVFNPDIDNCTI